MDVDHVGEALGKKSALRRPGGESSTSTKHARFAEPNVNPVKQSLTEVESPIRINSSPEKVDPQAERRKLRSKTTELELRKMLGDVDKILIAEAEEDREFKKKQASKTSVLVPQKQSIRRNSGVMTAGVQNEGISLNDAMLFVEQLNSEDRIPDFALQDYMSKGGTGKMVSIPAQLARDSARALKRARAQVAVCEAEVDAKRDEIDLLRKQISEQNTRISELNPSALVLPERLLEIASLNERTRIQAQELAMLHSTQLDLQAKEAELDVARATLERLQKELDLNKTQLREKNYAILCAESEIKDHKNELQRLTERCSMLELDKALPSTQALDKQGKYVAIPWVNSNVMSMLDFLRGNNRLISDAIQQKQRLIQACLLRHQSVSDLMHLGNLLSSELQVLTEVRGRTEDRCSQLQQAHRYLEDEQNHKVALESKQNALIEKNQTLRQRVISILIDRFNFQKKIIMCCQFARWLLKTHRSRRALLGIERNELRALDNSKHRAFYIWRVRFVKQRSQARMAHFFDEYWSFRLKLRVFQRWRRKQEFDRYSGALATLTEKAVSLISSKVNAKVLHAMFLQWRNHVSHSRIMRRIAEANITKVRLDRTLRRNFAGWFGLSHAASLEKQRQEYTLKLVSSEQEHEFNLDRAHQASNLHSRALILRVLNFRRNAQWTRSAWGQWQVHVHQAQVYDFQVAMEGKGQQLAELTTIKDRLEAQRATCVSAMVSIHDEAID
jgi:hypothetical protein